MQLPINEWKGKINKINVEGAEIGGQTTLPFLDFEGKISKPILGMDISIKPPVPEISIKQIGDVVKDPLKWALYCQDECKAEIINLNLEDVSESNIEEYLIVFKEILEKINIPLIINVGPGEIEKELLKKCAKTAFELKKKIILANALEEDYKSVAALSIAYGHYLIAQTPMDINLAKQLNMLLAEIGVSSDNIIIDPLSSPLGYGLEYTYSMFERIREDGLKGENMLQMPIIGYATKAWEARETFDSGATPEDINKLGPLWETTNALSFLVSGADIIIIRNPETMKTIQNIISM